MPSPLIPPRRLHKEAKIDHNEDTTNVRGIKTDQKVKSGQKQAGKDVKEDQKDYKQVIDESRTRLKVRWPFQSTVTQESISGFSTPEIDAPTVVHYIKPSRPTEIVTTPPPLVLAEPMEALMSTRRGSYNQPEADHEQDSTQGQKQKQRTQQGQGGSQRKRGGNQNQQEKKGRRSRFHSSASILSTVPDYVINYLRGETPESIKRRREYDAQRLISPSNEHGEQSGQRSGHGNNRDYADSALALSLEGSGSGDLRRSFLLPTASPLSMLSSPVSPGIMSDRGLLEKEYDHHHYHTHHHHHHFYDEGVASPSSSSSSPTRPRMHGPHKHHNRTGTGSTSVWWRNMTEASFSAALAATAATAAVVAAAATGSSSTSSGMVKGARSNHVKQRRSIAGAEAEGDAVAMRERERAVGVMADETINEMTDEADRIGGLQTQKGRRRRPKLMFLVMLLAVLCTGMLAGLAVTLYLVLRK